MFTQDAIEAATRSFRSPSRRNQDWKAGVRAAADVADVYNAVTTHGHRLGDCIASKLNVRNKPPRKNKQRLEGSALAITRGIVIGVAEMLRVCHDQSAARHVLKAAGITRKVAVAAQVMPHDLNEIEWRR